MKDMNALHTSTHILLWIIAATLPWLIIIYVAEEKKGPGCSEGAKSDEQGYLPLVPILADPCWEFVPCHAQCPVRHREAPKRKDASASRQRCG